MLELIKDVYLEGQLADLVGAGPHRMNARNMQEVVSYFATNYSQVDFIPTLKDMPVTVVLGDRDTGRSLDESETHFSIPAKEVHIIPRIAGSGGMMGGGGGGGEGGNSMWKMIVGGLLIGVAFLGTMGAGAGLGAALFGNTLGITGTQVALLGAGLILSAFTSAPQSDYAEREEVSSAVYRGALNVDTQGMPVPYIAGNGVIVGGVVFHTSVEIERVAV